MVANLSTIDKSDLLTVRSVPEAEEPQPEQPLPRPAPAPASAYEDLVFSLASVTDTELESEEVGGIRTGPDKKLVSTQPSIPEEHAKHAQED